MMRLDQEALQKVRAAAPPRPTFGDFIAARHGPKWVYAHRATPRLLAQYGPDVSVITPKQQRALNVDYRKLYGPEYDDLAWLALVALRSVAAGATDMSAVRAAISAIEGGA